MNITTVPANRVLTPPAVDASGSSKDIEGEDVEGVVVVAVAGDIDLYTGPDLRRALADLLTPRATSPAGPANPGGPDGPDDPDDSATSVALQGAANGDGDREENQDQDQDRDRGRDGDVPFRSVWAVVVDLREVEFIDSFAVGVLVRGHHLARCSGRAYALVATHPMIHKLFEITGLARVMPLHPDVAAAVAGLGPATRAAASAASAPKASSGHGSS